MVVSVVEWHRTRCKRPGRQMQGPRFAGGYRCEHDGVATGMTNLSTITHPAMNRAGARSNEDFLRVAERHLLMPKEARRMYRPVTRAAISAIRLGPSCDS